MRIVVAMSGGVDSSVAAALLAEAGHDVVGLSMQLYDQSAGRQTFGGCCSLDDLHDARRVAAAIGVPHYVLNLERQFDEQVVSDFVRQYVAGRTPLPCARCNGELKFSTLVTRSLGFGASALATGHYARVERDTVTGRCRLLRGADRAKDQSYFLFSLTQEQLARAVFPVGELSKHAVREHARRRALPVADKPDSQELCFVADQDYASLVTARAPGAAAAGAIVDQDGRVLGQHDGIHRFTVGQRRGLALARPAASPLYVLALRPGARQVVVGPRAALERTTLTASDVNWVAGSLDGLRSLQVQIRHRHAPAPATVRAFGDACAEVVFDAPQLAITPGQAAVFYDGDEVVGGGWIE
jgi:tRNA-specific 2-thiouridylase